MEPAATTTTGIYCQQCGYDLRASKEGGRCPECGRVFSPGDPKTFRPRPFAAPWKRALGRWAKRGAILLLVLVVLLAGLWGWFYWGWQREQAALARLGAKGEATFPEGWQARAARWAGPRWGRRAGFVLQRVTWAQLPVTAADAELAALRRLPRLRSLNLVGTKLTGAGLAHLADLPELRDLYLAETPLTDADLEPLEKLPQLQSLTLEATQVTDAGILHVAKLAHLRRLDLGKTRVTDAGLARLAALPRLQWLDLRGTTVTRAGLATLAALPDLRHLAVQDTRLAPADLRVLQARRPDCIIEGP